MATFNEERGFIMSDVEKNLRLLAGRGGQPVFAQALLEILTNQQRLERKLDDALALLDLDDPRDASPVEWVYPMVDRPEISDPFPPDEIT